MVKVTVGSNTKRATIIVESNKSVNEILQENDIKVGTATLCMDGSPLTEEEKRMTLVDLGVNDDEEILISAITKAESASRF